MSARRVTRSLVIAAMAATGVGVWAAAPSATAASIDVYAYANGCYTLRDASTNRWVARDVLGFHAGATSASAATPFRMQATALGRYLLYGTGGQMVSVGPLNGVPATTTPSVAADWAIADGGNGRLRISSVANGKGLGVGVLRRLGQSPTADARWVLQPAQGCAVFPEISVNATGTPLRTPSVNAPVRGFLDSHTHVSGFQFLGGKFHCGKPWSPYGVTVALRDCPDHGLHGETALFENVLSTGSPI